MRLRKRLSTSESNGVHWYTAGVGLRQASVNICCLDINECSEMEPCHQVCSNTIGSFDCACFDGFTFSSDNETCIRMIYFLFSCYIVLIKFSFLCLLATENCDISNLCEQICSKNLTSGNETCTCFKGFRLDSNKWNCSGDLIMKT